MKLEMEPLACVFGVCWRSFIPVAGCGARKWTDDCCPRADIIVGRLAVNKGKIGESEETQSVSHTVF